MPSMQAQINDLLTYANKIDARLGELDVAFTARVLTLEAKVEALEAKHTLQGAQVTWLRSQLKNKAAKIEGLETHQAVQAAESDGLKAQQAVQAAQIEQLVAHIHKAPGYPNVGAATMDIPIIDDSIDDHIEMPTFKDPCTGCKSTHSPFLHEAQAIKFPAEEIDALPLNRKARYEAQKAQRAAETTSIPMEDAVALPKYRRRCQQDAVGRTCTVENCPWTHQVQIDAFSTEAIEALSLNRDELRARARGDV